MTRLAQIGASDYGKKGLTLLLFLPLALLLATAVMDSSNYVLLMAVAGIMFFSILTSFQVALVLIAVFGYFFAYAIWVFDLPGPLINLGYLLIIMLLLREFFFTAGFVPVRMPVNFILVSIVALGFLSIANGESSFYPSIKGLLRHVGFPLFFILLLTAEPDEELIRKLVIGVLVVVFLQIPASIGQYFWYSVVAPKSAGMRADYSGGLLGPSCGNYSSVLLVMGFCLLMGFMLVRGNRWYLSLGAALLVVPIYLASARAGLIMFALGALFMLLIAPRPGSGNLFKRVLVSLSVVAGLVGASYMGLGGESFQAMFHPEYLYEYSMKKADAGMGRLQAFGVVSQELRTPVEKLIGRGPGMLTPTSVVDNPNSLVANAPHLFRNVTGYTYTTIELGFLGFILFLLLYFKVYRFNRLFLSRIDDPFWESVSLGFSGVVFIYVLSTFYVDSWIYYPLPFTFWAVAGAIYRVGVIRGIMTV